MEATEVSIKDILSCRSFLIVAVISYKEDSFIMGYHVYETLHRRGVESTNSVDKYAVAVQRNCGQVNVGHFPLGNSEKYVKTIF